MEKYGRARQDTDDNIVRRMRIAYLITKATDARSEYLILNTFPRQQWLDECALVLHYMLLPCFLLFLAPIPTIRIRLKFGSYIQMCLCMMQLCSLSPFRNAEAFRVFERLIFFR